MRYRITRIEKVINGQSSFEHCSLIVSNIEKFRKQIDADEVNFVYEMLNEKQKRMKEPDIEMNLKKIMERIKWIRETKAILSKEEISLSIPLMQDLSQVGNIYDKFMSYHAGRNSTMVRKQFIFVILYLYSPSALGGSKMRRGLREKIAKVLGCTCSNVSHDYKNISFYYVTYRSFRNDVNEILDKLLMDLGLKEIGEA